MNKLPLTAFLTAAMALSLVFPCFVAANTNGDAAWTTQTIYTRVAEGSSSSALDSNNNPHVSYSNYQYIEFTQSTPSMHNDTLWYGVYNGSSWNIQNVDPNPVVLSTSVALDGSNNPHIAYGWKADANASIALKYASYNGSAWNIEIVDSSAYFPHPSLALDSNGNPHISYCNSSGSQLKYASWNGTGWSIQIVDPTDSSVSTSQLVLDHNGYPHITYYETSPNLLEGTLKYAFWNGTNWTIQTLLADSPGLSDFSFALDSNGAPYIAYNWHNFTGESFNYALKSVSWNGSAWNTEVVSSTMVQTGDDYYTGLSLQLDKQNYPHLTYQILNSLNGTDFYTLEYAYWDGSSWSIQVVPSQHPIGSSILMLDPAGNPHVVFEDLYNLGLEGNLVYASAVEPSLSPSPSIPEILSSPTLTASLSESASALNYGNTINFTVTTDGGVPPYTFNWNIDGQFLPTTNVPYFFTNSSTVGSHHVYVQVIDSNGNSATTLTVEFNVLPTLNPSTSSSPPIPEFPAATVLFLFLTIIITVTITKARTSSKRNCK